MRFEGNAEFVAPNAVACVRGHSRLASNQAWGLLIKRLYDNLAALQLFIKVELCAAQLHATGLVHIQNLNRRASDLRLSKNQEAATLEVFRPAILGEVQNRRETGNGLGR